LTPEEPAPEEVATEEVALENAMPEDAKLDNHKPKDTGPEGLFDLEFDHSFSDDDFGTSYDDEFEEGGDGFVDAAEDDMPEKPVEPLRLDPTAHVVATPYIAEADRSELREERRPLSETAKGGLLPQLAPPEEGGSDKVVMPRRVNKVTPNGSARTERPRRPAADIGIKAEQKKTPLSPLNSLSNLRGVFAATEESQSGRAD